MGSKYSYAYSIVLVYVTPWNKLCGRLWVRAVRVCVFIDSFTNGHRDSDSSSSVCACARKGERERVRETMSAAAAAWASQPCLLGIDEAGRGPVLGTPFPITLPLYLFLVSNKQYLLVCYTDEINEFKKETKKKTWTHWMIGSTQRNMNKTFY